MVIPGGEEKCTFATLGRRLFEEGIHANCPYFGGTVPPFPNISTAMSS